MDLSLEHLPATEEERMTTPNDQSEFATRLKRKELFTTLVLVLVAIILTQSVFLFSPTTAPVRVSGYLATLIDKVAIAILVAIAVRWVNVFLGDKVVKIAAQPSSRVEVMTAVPTARKRLWFAQNWLHNGELQANKILDAVVPSDQLRVIFASFRRDDDPERGWVSPIYARGRSRGLDPSDMKSHVKESVMNFAKANRTDCLRFNYGHCPAWIVVVDNDVYWGPTPIHESNWNLDIHFNHDKSFNPLGAYWIDQFERMWSTSHQLDVEAGFNEKLSEFIVPDARLTLRLS